MISAEELQVLIGMRVNKLNDAAKELERVATLLVKTIGKNGRDFYGMRMHSTEIVALALTVHEAAAELDALRCVGG